MIESIKEVYVCGQKLELIEDPNLRMRTGNAGICNLVEGNIVISGDMSKDMTGDTLIHEIFEAIDHVFELKLKHRQITTLSAAVYMMMKDNPHLLEAMLND